MIVRSLRRIANLPRAAPLGCTPIRAFAHDFLERLHIPLDENDKQKMLSKIGFKEEGQFLKSALSAELLNEVPRQLYRKEIPVIKQYIENKIRGAKKNTSFSGQGFYNTAIPAVVERTVLTNPMWYTAYTPYQAEISQGRLEALFNYQITVKRITKMEMANACLLDEATAGAEAVLMAHRAHNHTRKTVIVLDSVFVNTRAVIKSTAKELGIKVVEVAQLTPELIETHKSDLIGFVCQTPDTFGFLHDFSKEIEQVRAVGGLGIVGTDLMACLVCKTPGEMNADVTFGNGQRFGTPMGFGGPHAAFFATKMENLRRMPGRIVSVTKDAEGNTAYRLAVTTREQHIRRELATSNICTSQVLLANLNYFFALYHSEEGLLDLASTIHKNTAHVYKTLQELGVKFHGGSTKHPQFFDTLTIRVEDANALIEFMKSKKISVYRHNKNLVSFSIDECNNLVATGKFLRTVLRGLNKQVPRLSSRIDDKLSYLIPREAGPIFKPTDIINKIKGEHELLRYITRLARKDITLCDSMIPLGSCTMKLNAAFEMQMYGNPALNIHPYVFGKFSKAYDVILKELSVYLCRLTGMEAVTYQSNSGATGEYVGLKTMKRYHESRGEGNRNIVLIPASAHGTNPASATKMGLKVVVVQVAPNGYINQEDFVAKVSEHKANLFGLMLTYPSTHGVFEENTIPLISLVHKNGGQVYIDGANMNAQIGITSPGYIGGDVCHLNLHKTFSIPHGGGGPGMGPVLVKNHLASFLPSHHEYDTCAFNQFGDAIRGKGDQTLSSPYGSASILMISYIYAISMGISGLRNCSVQAITSANYLAKKLGSHFKVLYTNSRGLVGHEFILDIRPIKAEIGITEEDIAKRLMDYNFHSPTMSFPVPGTLMVEPTESENLEELDRFAEAMIQIHREIELVRTGQYDKLDNPLKNAPHTLAHVTGSEWNHSYPREVAAYPLPWLRTRGKVWPSVARINSANAERNLMFELSA